MILILNLIVIDWFGISGVEYFFALCLNPES